MYFQPNIISAVLCNILHSILNYLTHDTAECKLMQILVWPKIFLTILDSFMKNLTSFNCVIPTEITFLCKYKVASRYVEF